MNLSKATRESHAKVYANSLTKKKTSHSTPPLPLRQREEELHCSRPHRSLFLQHYFKVKLEKEVVKREIQPSHCDCEYLSTFYGLVPLKKETLCTQINLEEPRSVCSDTFYKEAAGAICIALKRCSNGWPRSHNQILSVLLSLLPWTEGRERDINPPSLQPHIENNR